MPVVQDIAVWAEVEITQGEQNFRVTKVDVQRRTGLEIGKATVKGVMDDIDTIYPAGGSELRLYVSQETSERPWADSNINGEQIWDGEILAAYQDENGVVTYECYDARSILHDSAVQLYSQYEHPYNILFDILDDEIRSTTPTTNLSEASDEPLLTPYIAPPQDFPAIDTGEIVEGSPRENFIKDLNNAETADELFAVLGENQPSSTLHSKWIFGNGEQGEPAVSVIRRLLDTLGGVIFVDKEGVLRMEGYPESTVWITPLITEINAGESNRNAKRVIFESNALASVEGQDKTTNSIYRQNSYNESIDIEGTEEEGPGPPEKRLEDHNIVSYEEAENRTTSEAMRQEKNRDMGKITIIGNPLIELHDHVYVPQLEYEINGAEDQDISEIQSGLYRVSGVIHKLNSNDGFLTTLELSPSYPDITDNVSGEFSQAVFEQYSNNVEEIDVSGVGDSGPLSGLFGNFTPDREEIEDQISTDD